MNAATALKGYNKNDRNIIEKEQRLSTYRKKKHGLREILFLLSRERKKKEKQISRGGGRGVGESDVARRERKEKALVDKTKRRPRCQAPVAKGNLDNEKGVEDQGDIQG